MASKGFPTITDQVTERLRQGIQELRWRKALPGRNRLAEDLGCSPWTVEEAVERLTREGLLVSPGPGQRRRIVRSEGIATPRALRLQILLYEESDRKAPYMVDLLHRLRDTGHDAVFGDKTMRELRMDVARIARFVAKSEADAWIIMAGSRDILEWFAGQETPAFALFGRSSQSSLASIRLEKAAALTELADRFVDLGHRRIVFFARSERRKPNPGILEQLFLDRLEERGLPTGPYNLPDWGDSPAAFRKMLNSLFQHTPPTALIVDQASLCVAVLQHLSRLGLSAPEDVSLACTDMDDCFDWCDPGITHVAWNPTPVVNRVVKWAQHVARGEDHRRKDVGKVRLVPGGTTGTPPKGR